MENQKEDRINVCEYGESISFVIIKGTLGRCAIDATLTNILDCDVILNRLVVHEKYRRQGIANKLMKAFCEYLDSKNYSCILSIEADGDMNEDELVKYYNKFGFISIKEDLYNMVRGRV